MFCTAPAGISPGGGCPGYIGLADADFELKTFVVHEHFCASQAALKKSTLRVGVGDRTSGCGSSVNAIRGPMTYVPRVLRTPGVRC